MKSILTIFILFAGVPSYAYYSVLSTGDILPEGKYTATAESQFITDPGGVNVSGRFDSGINESTGFRGLLGAGKTDVFAGALIKYVPYPDVEGQPAVGFNGGLLYASDEGFTQFTFRFEPLVSKKFTTTFGHFTPYASVPVGLEHRTKGSDKSDLAVQLVGGTELGIERWEGLRFMFEGGVDLENAYNHISIAAVFDFAEDGFKLNLQ